MFGNGQPGWFAQSRRDMVEEQLRNRGISDDRLLAAMAHVPRHEFVSGEYQSQAYGDHPLPIACGQTISQPYIVAAMLQAAELDPGHIVLEIGTGSGYQTAVLAELVDHVYTIERHHALAAVARKHLERLGYSNVTVLIGDGTQGLAALAPFHAIIVSAAAPQIPAPLFEQLREGGCLVIPVGGSETQELQLVRKRGGLSHVRHLDACRFVPLIGSRGFDPE